MLLHPAEYLQYRAHLQSRDAGMVDHREHVAGTVWAYAHGTERRHGVGGRRTYTGLNGAGITSAERFYNGAPPPQITITSNVATIVFNVTGTVCGAGSYLTPTTLAWTPGASCTVQASPSTPYVFESWSDGSTENPRTLWRLRRIPPTASQ